MPEHHTPDNDIEDETDATSDLDELGTLVLRVWREPTGDRPLRVRILASQGPGEPTSIAVLDDQEAALAAVRTWLDSESARLNA